MSRLDLVFLEADARSAANARGHRLSPWHETDDWAAEAGCTNEDCVAWIQVQVMTPANGLDISGPALTVTCPHRAEPPWR